MTRDPIIAMLQSKDNLEMHQINKSAYYVGAHNLGHVQIQPLKHAFANKWFLPFVHLHKKFNNKIQFIHMPYRTIVLFFKKKKVLSSEAMVYIRRCLVNSRW